MIFISQNTSNNLKRLFNRLDTVIEIKSLDVVYESINHHPDIYLFCSSNKIYISKEQYESVKDQLKDCQLPIEVIENQLGYRYPQTVSFNGILLGEYFIHNLNHTSPFILEDMKKANKKLIHVNQGYTRCSALPVDENSIITSDIGIAKTCESNGIEVCLIRNGSILLPGQSYGFIGGCGGRIGDSVYFTGDITKHPNYGLIRDFIYKQNLEIKYDSGSSLIDLGSILTFDSSTNQSCKL